MACVKTVLLGVALLAVALPGAHAQDVTTTTTTTTIVMPPPPPPPPAPVASGGSTNPATIARCLCDQQRLQLLHRRAASAEHAYRQAQARLDALNRQIAAGKDTVNVNDPAQVDAQRQLVEQDQQANAALFNHSLPDAQQGVDRYNHAVSDYNAACVNQLFDSTAFAAVTQTLNCPAEREP